MTNNNSNGIISVLRLAVGKSSPLMKRYLRVLLLFWSTAIAAELEYRLNFAIAALSSSTRLAGNLFSLFLFYRTGYTFPGWSWEEALIVMGIFTLLQGFSATVLVPNLNRIVNHVRKGTLDFVLLKPINSQFWLSMRTLSPWGFPDLIFGSIVVLYASQRLQLGWRNFLPIALPLFCAFIILYSLWFILSTTSIWFVKIYNVTEVLESLLQAGRFPMAAYPAAYRVFFTFIIPVAFLTTVPAEVALGRTQPTWLFGTAGLSLALFFASTRFWRFALRFYTSASS